MSDRGKGRLVYSTGIGSICPGCGWPERDCKCSSRSAPAEPVPTRVVAKQRPDRLRAVDLANDVVRDVDSGGVRSGVLNEDAGASGGA